MEWFDERSVLELAQMPKFQSNNCKSQRLLLDKLVAIENNSLARLIYQ